MYLTAMSETVYLSTKGVAGNNAAVRPRTMHGPSALRAASSLCMCGNIEILPSLEVVIDGLLNCITMQAVM